MESRVNTDIQSIKIIYNRNKHFIIPFVVIIICIWLIMQVIIPQLNTLFEVREEAKNASQRLTQLEKDLSILTSLDEKTLESQIKTSTLALPINKDFGEVLSALYSAANASGVNIGKFSFQVGDLAKSDEKDKKFSSMELTISLDNDIGTVNNFIDIIGKTLPISDTSFVKTNNKISTLSLVFYYKVLSAPNVQKDERIVPISNEKLSLLSKISDFKNALSENLSSESSLASPSSATLSPKSTNPFSQ